MTSHIGDAIAGIHGIHFQPVGVAPVAIKFMNIHNAFGGQVVAMHGVRIWIGMTALMTL
jgi:hypothetical protein